MSDTKAPDEPLVLYQRDGRTEMVFVESVERQQVYWAAREDAHDRTDSTGVHDE